MRATEFLIEKNRKRKRTKLRKYFFPGFAYYGGYGGEDSGGDGGGGESMYESAVDELKQQLPSLKKHDYDTIDRLMRSIAKKHKITGKALLDVPYNKEKILLAIQKCFIDEKFRKKCI